MPLLTSTPGQRLAVSRNRQTGTRIQVAENARHGVYTVVSCEAHGAERLANSWNEGCTVARTPQAFCEACRNIQPTVNRQQRRAAARATAAAARRGERLGLRRRFGVEFEFVGMQRHTVQTWLNTSGLGGHGWRVKGDCSVRPTGRQGGQGLELVSPPLQGEEGFRQMRTALEFLNANGADVNRTCGTHVHFDVADQGIDGLKRMARTWHDNQDLINFLVSPSRRTGNQYCQPLAASEVASIERMADRYSSYNVVSRYRTLNVASFGRHGTVEVRQHQGTLSFEKMVAWIKLGMGLLDTCAETGRAVARQGGIQSLLNAAQVDEDQAAFLLGRAVQFGAPVATVAA